MAIRCGHCRGQHESVASVKACHGQVDIVARPGPATVGMYRRGGQIYKVDWTSNGHLFAKLATIGQDEIGRTIVSWTGAPGVVARLTQAHRMDKDEVAAFGKLTGTCMRCGIELTHPDSVAAGIGPICAKRV